MNSIELEIEILEQKLKLLKIASENLEELMEARNSEMVAAIAELAKSV